MLESIANSIKSAAGITPLTDYIVVDERKQGYVNTILEIKFEQYQQHFMFRLRVTDFKGSGKSGRTRKAFDWPVADPDNPLELVSIADRILAACEPDAEKIDPRGPIGRFFDRLFGIHVINHIPCLDKTASPVAKTLSAKIDEDKFGVTVTLYHKVERGGLLWMRMPLASVRKLREWAERS